MKILITHKTVINNYFLEKLNRIQYI